MHTAPLSQPIVLPAPQTDYERHAAAMLGVAALENAEGVEPGPFRTGLLDLAHAAAALAGDDRADRQKLKPWADRIRRGETGMGADA